MPDVVGDSEGTLESFKIWYPVIHKYYSVPLAYVLQDGTNENDIPWDSIAAMFIGGTTEWKLGDAAAKVVRKANAKNKWVHMGRVNTFKRVKYAYEIGCNSIDGSGFSRFPDAQIPKALDWLESLENEQLTKIIV
jgi:hypothetical protein